VLSHVAAVGNEASGTICAECGEQNEPAALTCRSCARPLLHSCPKCAGSLETDATSCLACGLSRTDFFEECVRQDIATRTAAARRKARFAAMDDIGAIAVVSIFILIAWWQQLRSEASEWKVWLGVTVWYLAMWALAKSR
jgi:uncharacterized membrane protein YvbJ